MNNIIHAENILDTIRSNAKKSNYNSKNISKSNEKRNYNLAKRDSSANKAYCNIENANIKPAKCNTDESKLNINIYGRDITNVGMNYISNMLVINNNHIILMIVRKVINNIFCQFTTNDSRKCIEI